MHKLKTSRACSWSLHNIVFRPATFQKRRTAMTKGISILLVLILGISTQPIGLPQSETQKDKPKQKTESAQKKEQKVKDPVCGMEIDAKSAAGKATYKGKTYYFCSVSEKEQFESEPAKYVK